jgi:MFS family permease
LSLFFGWYIVAAAVILTGYNSAMFVYGLTVFLTPIAATSGWTYTQISLATSIRGLQIGALDPVAGILVDRWPARRGTYFPVWYVYAGLTAAGMLLLLLLPSRGLQAPDTSVTQTGTVLS